MRTRTNRRRRQQGIAMMITLFSLLILFMVVATTLSASLVAHRLTERGSQKLQATQLAEAAVNAHYDAIKNALATTGNYPTALAPMNMVGTVDGVTQSDGVYSSKIVGTPGAVSLDLLNTLGVKVGLKLVWTFVLEGKGVSPDGLSQSTVRATFTAIQLRATVQAAAPSPFTANAAIQSNSNVTMVTDGGLHVAAPSGGSANVLASGGASWQTVTVAKSANQTANVINVDGLIEVPAAPDPAYAATTGASGMGNPNNFVNFQTRAVAATGSQAAVPANSIDGVSGSQTLVSTDQIAAWQTNWSQEASTGTQFSSSVTTQTITPNLLGQHVITAPAYINGDLQVNSGSVYLQPNLDSSKPNVIFVNGNIDNAANLYNGGVVLICTGSYNDSSSTAQYSLQSALSLLVSPSSLYGTAGLVALNGTADAISLNANNNSPVGLVYAPAGGIQVQGNGGMHGALVAGGAGANGGVVLDPTTGAFTLSFEPSALSRSDFPVSANSIQVGAVISLAPTGLTNWLQVQ